MTASASTSSRAAAALEGATLAPRRCGGRRAVAHDHLVGVDEAFHHLGGVAVGDADEDGDALDARAPDLVDAHLADAGAARRAIAAPRAGGAAHAGELHHRAAVA